MLAKLTLAAMVWAMTVFVRFWIRVEPGEAEWYMWVAAQGICAASFGFTFANSDFQRRRR